MSIAEGVSARVSYKEYATGVITANTEPALAADPGNTGGQVLRRVTSTLKLVKDGYQSNEVRSDYQIADFRHGARRVTGSLTGELSGLTYADFFEAACRGTWEAELSLSEAELTSLAADNASSTLIAGGGDPVALGVRVGHILRLANASDPDDNAKNFLVLGFSGGSNRTIKVYPAPDTMSADTDFDLTTLGKRLSVPSTGHVKRKFLFEHYNSDIAIARAFTECRIGGFTMQLPATGMSTIEFPVMGRNMQVLKDGAAPFLTAPASETSTGIFASVNGLIQLNGATVGVVTGVNIQMNLNPEGPAVVGQNVAPEISLGRANVTGQITAFLQDGILLGNFTDEDEVSVLLYLTTKTAPDTPAFSIFLPRIKFSDADVPVAGEGLQSITLPFQALKHAGAPGIEATTIQIVDTAVT